MLDLPNMPKLLKHCYNFKKSASFNLTHIGNSSFSFHTMTISPSPAKANLHTQHSLQGSNKYNNLTHYITTFTLPPNVLYTVIPEIHLVYTRLFTGCMWRVIPNAGSLGELQARIT
jgi:hypothetical protein